jgi:hypothetical protein
MGTTPMGTGGSSGGGSTGGSGGGDPHDDDDVDLNPGGYTPPTTGGDVDWSDVANDLHQEAQNIRDDYWTDVWEEMIASGITGGIGGAFGWGMKCPVAQAYCAAAGFFIGSFTEVVIAGQVALVLEADADSYEATASLILQGMDDSGQLHMSITHNDGFLIGVNSPYIVTNVIDIPEHYMLSVEGVNEPVIVTPSQMEYINLLIQSNTGP